jgi:hypothetical protein
MATIVRYFVLETDEYLEPKNPNIFRITKPSEQIILKDIKERFVDWKGGFRFYFKTVLEKESDQSKYVWEDVIDESSSIPTYQGAITLKAVRIGFKQFFEIKTREKDTSLKALPKRTNFLIFCKFSQLQALQSQNRNSSEHLRQPMMRQRYLNTYKGILTVWNNLFLVLIYS